jgi:hypothetical protein
MVGPEAEPRGEVYSAACNTKQAALVFAEVEATIAAVPEFAQFRGSSRIFLPRNIPLVIGRNSRKAMTRSATGSGPVHWDISVVYFAA